MTCLYSSTLNPEKFREGDGVIINDDFVLLAFDTVVRGGETGTVVMSIRRLAI